MSKSIKSKFKAGDVVQTSAKFLRVTGFRERIEGVVLRAAPYGDGVWLVQMTPFVRPQRVHESMLERKQ